MGGREVQYMVRGGSIAGWREVWYLIRGGAVLGGREVQYLVRGGSSVGWEGSEVHGKRGEQCWVGGKCSTW